MLRIRSISFTNVFNGVINIDCAKEVLIYIIPMATKLLF